jgi:imidazolonepropionase-like amidohydrolase
METWPEHKLGCADGPYEIRKKVREAARAGADQIKTASSGHVWVGTGKTLLSQTKEEFEALVDEAHMHGMKVMCHCSPRNPEPMLHAIEAGVDTIEHARGLTDEVIDGLVKSKIIIVPTLSIYVRNYRDPSKPCSTAEREARERQHTELLERVKKAHQAGVKIAFGTDTYRVLRDYWTSAAYELQMYVEAGLKEKDAITFVTKNASEALGLEKKVGTIEMGKLADMIVVDGNPLDDIKILADNDKIHYVLKNGEVVVDRVDKGGTLLL